MRRVLLNYKESRSEEIVHILYGEENIAIDVLSAKIEPKGHIPVPNEAELFGESWGSKSLPLGGEFIEEWRMSLVHTFVSLNIHRIYHFSTRKNIYYRAREARSCTH